MVEYSPSTPSIESSSSITVSGPPGSGATTLCTRLVTAVGCQYVSGGDSFRDLAAERGLSPNQQIAKADASDEIDPLTSTLL